MPHPYCPKFDYLGRHTYLVTLVTYRRAAIFATADTVSLVWKQILRAALQTRFVVIVYVFMHDHLHVIVQGLEAHSDLKQFVPLAKQFAGYSYARANRGRRLWQKGKHDYIVRGPVDLLTRVRYVVNNPVAAGLVSDPRDYPFLGSQRWSLDELLDWCKTGRSPGMKDADPPP